MRKKYNGRPHRNTLIYAINIVSIISRNRHKNTVKKNAKSISPFLNFKMFDGPFKNQKKHDIFDHEKPKT